MIAATVPASGLLLTSDAQADFDPSGRRRPGGRPTTGPTRPGPARPQNPEAGPAKGPSADALIQRYTGIVLQQPTAPFPLQRLAQLYRERDGDLKKLVDDFEKRVAAGGADAAASKLALAGIYKIENRLDDAIRIYREVIAAHPKDPGPIQALAQLQLDRGNLAEARTLYASVLPLLTAAPDKEGVLRNLLKIALDLKDWAGAKTYHKDLVKLAGGSLLVKGELGRELMNRSEFALAEVEYRELVAAATGDNRALAPALAELGRVLTKQRKNQEAMDVLKRALSIAGSEAGVRAEVYNIMTEAYRAESKLPELITILEAEKSGDFHHLNTLGLLYEETGQVDKALVTYRKALAANPRHIDTRLKVIHILQAQGELDQAIKEYEALIRSVPNNPDFVFELCDTLIQRGDRAKALQLLTQAEARAGGDDEQLSRVADFYERIEEHARALKILQRLAGSGAQDPQYVIDLGDRYFQQGEQKKAMDTWARIKVIIPNRAKALSTLGEVYMEHDLAREAIDALREAAQLEPDNLRYQKNLALALERTAVSQGDARGRYGGGPRYTEARAIWEKILLKSVSTGDKAQAREARMHIVTLWALGRELPAQVPALARKFAATPPDVDAGWMLAEVQIRLQQLPQAEATLVKLTQLEPGDSDLHLTLERVYVLEHKLDDAIKTLKHLAQIDPKRARQYYQRMAQYAAELYKDDDAVAYAAQAVALAPDDADGHRKLGEMYRRRQDNERAISEFRAAITKNDRLYLVYFDLAELLLARGQTDEADSLYRRVVRSCPDDELVARSARLSMQLNLGRGTLEQLERELLPVALGHPQKPLYRRLLVDLYGAMAFPLVQRVRYSGPQEAASAREQLTKMGARAVKPLLDALVDENQQQQNIAIEVLAFVENKNAGPSLFAFATGNAEQSLRVRAMIACGALRDPALLPKYKTVLAPSGDAPPILGGPIAVAAAWGVARMNDKRAVPLLTELAKASTPELRALALLGLGASQEKSAAAIAAEVASSPDAGNVARAAAAWTLAQLGSSQHADVLLAMARSQDSLPREASLLALSRLEPTKARTVVAESLFDPSASVRKAAFASAVVLVSRDAAKGADPFAVPDGMVDVRAILQGMIPPAGAPAQRVQALLGLEEPITRAALDGARTSPERAILVADAMLARPNAPGLAPFTDEMDKLPEADRAKAELAASKMAKALAPAYVALLRHPMTELRIRAVRMLARVDDPAANEAVVDALGDSDESVQRAALAVLAETHSEAAIRAVSKILAENPSWALRVRAASALGSLSAGGSHKEAIASLSGAARKDKFALVRKASMEALAKLSPAEARPVLESIAGSDPEPDVRDAAKKLMK
jgi:cellulose synthase operon protein C